jgi:hypothetical protein
MNWIPVVLLSFGIPIGVSQAVSAFDSGYLYLRRIGMESPLPEPERDPATAIPIYTDGCEVSSGQEYQILIWNETMKRLWKGVNTAETNFTVRAGDEYLIYDSFLLFYSGPEGRTGITIRPEELWTILSHCRRPLSAATGQVSMEAWFPDLDSPATAFVTVNDPAMPVIQRLLQSGRDSITEE